MLNSLTMDNVAGSVGKELAHWTRRGGPGRQTWFLHYLIAQRVASENNNHPTYVLLVSNLAEGDTAARKMTLATTYHYIRVLLASDVLALTTERIHLRNLGSWLGQLTLARNKPVLHRELSLKQVRRGERVKERE